LDERFAKAAHTVVVSDLHLTDAQPRLPDRPLWKRYKQRDLFIDDCFSRFVDHLLTQLPVDSELILAGDIFDFDAVMTLPPPPSPFPVSWLERQRGLGAEELRSTFKMRVILGDHPVFLQALRTWIGAGNRVIFVIGNHDIELHWPAVQRLVREALALPPEHRDALRICEWFYLSNGDSLIEHGNQYDAYCLCANPIHPTIQWRGEERVRVPFGNLAERYMLNGMGLFNPHVEGSFIMSLSEYVRFFVKYMIRIQPLLGITWLWGAVVTLFVTLGEGFRPAIKDPLRMEERLAGIALRANASAGLVLGLQALHVHPAVFNPWKIMKELWLDRALILALLVGGSFELVTLTNVFTPVSPWWALVVFLVLLPFFIFYARGVNSDVDSTERALWARLPVALEVAHVQRLVMGHTHLEHHSVLLESRRGGQMLRSELLNTGTWSPAFRDVECTIPYGRKCFAWIRPDLSGGPRKAGLYVWEDPGVSVIAPAELAALRPRGLLQSIQAAAAEVASRAARGGRPRPEDPGGGPSSLR